MSDPALPRPPSGGSYVRHPDTGELTLVESTRHAPEAPPPTEVRDDVPAAKKKSPEGA